jgi:hypothetical protein
MNRPYCGDNLGSQFAGPILFITNLNESFFVVFIWWYVRIMLPLQPIYLYYSL